MAFPPTERLSVWGAAGYGAGELTLMAGDDPALKTDLGMTLAAAGARATLVGGDGPNFDAVTDARWVRTTTARVPEAWKAELGADWAQIWHTWRHTLGNLTWTAFNSEMGNRSFREKRDAERGFRNSPLLLNADLRETERWDEPAIRARGARLADLAVDTWRRPVLTDRVLASYETPRDRSGGYTIEHHPHLRPGAPMHDLFEAVRQAILALGPQVREEFRKHYVAYKMQTNFVDVVPQKRRLLLTLNMRFDELSDPRGLAADITNLGRWGNGDVQVELDNERQIPYAMELVRQAFAAKQPGGAADNPGDAPAS